MQVEDDEPGHRELRDEVEAAADTEKPELPIPERHAQAARLEHVFRRLTLADDRRAEGSTGQRERGQHEKRGAQRQPGQHERRHQTAERDRRLPNAQRKPPLAGREPDHHRATAGSVDARARRSGESEQDEERTKARGVTSADKSRPAAREPGWSRPLGPPGPSRSPGTACGA